MSSLVRWPARLVVGLWRCLVLVGLTGTIPAAAIAVGVVGFRFTLSWSDGLQAPVIAVLGALLGEVALATWWLIVTVWFSLALFTWPLCQATRLVAGRWLGLRIESPARPLTRTATGFWWNGYDYHRSRWRARLRNFRDPTMQRDVLWLAVASVTVLPAVAWPILALAGAGYAALVPELRPLAAVLAVTGLASAPFAWQLLEPLAPRLLGPDLRAQLDERIEALESMQADLTQAQAAELERIERDLHDGAQARLVALGMSLGAAERLVQTDPDRAVAMLREARDSSAAALAELRLLVRGINPPVLTERGLVDAVRALALDAPLETAVRCSVHGRAERPIESAVYFAIAELLANAAKHARASRATIELRHRPDTLTAVVSDDGVGGASASPGSGLSGVRRRIEAFGGHVRIDSPAGGPTRITVAVPCVLS